MPTKTARWAACAALALAAACSRPGLGGADDATASCPFPQGLATEHHPGYCALPADLRAFVSAHEEFKAFSGGEPADEAAMQALAREHEARVQRERQQWAQLRARYAADAPSNVWMARYERQQDWP